MKKILLLSTLVLGNFIHSCNVYAAASKPGGVFIFNIADEVSGLDSDQWVTNEGADRLQLSISSDKNIGQNLALFNRQMSIKLTKLADVQTLDIRSSKSLGSFIQINLPPFVGKLSSLRKIMIGAGYYPYKSKALISLSLQGVEEIAQLSQVTNVDIVVTKRASQEAIATLQEGGYNCTSTMVADGACSRLKCQK